MSEATNVRDQGAASDPVFRLIYRSHSRIPDDAANEELGRILRRARAKNATLGITGALMVYDGWFAQALEGPEEAVRALFASICRDARHDGIELGAQGFVAERVFSRWAMAHVGEHGDPDIPLTATATGVTEGAAWRVSEAQEGVLTALRDLTRGYGIGA